MPRGLTTFLIATTIAVVPALAVRAADLQAERGKYLVEVGRLHRLPYAWKPGRPSGHDEISRWLRCRFRSSRPWCVLWTQLDARSGNRLGNLDGAANCHRYHNRFAARWATVGASDAVARLCSPDHSRRTCDRLFPPEPAADPKQGRGAVWTDREAHRVGHVGATRRCLCDATAPEVVAASRTVHATLRSSSEQKQGCRDRLAGQVASSLSSTARWISGTRSGRSCWAAVGPEQKTHDASHDKDA